MKQRRRPYGLTAQQKRDLWDRWRPAESLSDIARALDKVPASVFTIVKKHGVVPRERCRSARVLSLVKREEISRGLQAGDTVRSVAAPLGTSTVKHQSGDRLEWLEQVNAELRSAACLR